MIILNEKQIECVAGGILARCVLDGSGTVATPVQYYRTDIEAVNACCNDAGGVGVQLIDNEVYGIGDYNPADANIPHRYEYCMRKTSRNLALAFAAIFSQEMM